MHNINLKLVNVPRSKHVENDLSYNFFLFQDGGTYAEVCGNMQKLPTDVTCMPAYIPSPIEPYPQFV